MAPKRLVAVGTTTLQAATILRGRPLNHSQLLLVAAATEKPTSKRTPQDGHLLGTIRYVYFSPLSFDLCSHVLYYELVPAKKVF